MLVGAEAGGWSRGPSGDFVPAAGGGREAWLPPDPWAREGAQPSPYVVPGCTWLCVRAHLVTRHCCLRLGAPHLIPVLLSPALGKRSVAHGRATELHRPASAPRLPWLLVGGETCAAGVPTTWSMAGGVGLGDGHSEPAGPCGARPCAQGCDVGAFPCCTRACPLASSAGHHWTSGSGVGGLAQQTRPSPGHLGAFQPGPAVNLL